MNNVDKQYLSLLKDILDNGKIKHTRAGDTLSVFGCMMRFNLQDGLPLLTTKKVFYRGCIEELIWFLNGDTNIKYLIERKVHIWTDDAYRWYKTLIQRHNDMVAKRKGHEAWVLSEPLKVYPILAKEDFLIETQHQTVLECYGDNYNDIISYTFGDLGDIYGKQWRRFGITKVDQIQNIINKLKTNPDDRRMLCVAYNPDVLEKVALPPCHIIFQFYTTEMTKHERLEWLWKHSNNEYDEWKSPTHEALDALNVPRRSLSLSFTMRSNDFCCGNPFNILQYGLLVYMIAEVCNMAVGELIYNGGDVHVYANHIEQAKEQLQRKGSDKIPTLRFARKVETINDFTAEDFIIENYEPDPPIKYPLNVG